ncbi:MAG TPA: ribosome silencing factor, partial [Chitinophagaceae bacterium]|nr:ribosome silencing factor [Chitinophagaceae bacterium]
MTSSAPIKKDENAIQRLNTESQIFRTIISAIHEKGGTRVISINLREIPEAVSDYFVICEAESAPQVRAIAEQVERSVKEKLKELPYEKEGFDSLHWIILDYVNIVVHIFQPELRSFY